MRYITASVSPHARLHPTAVNIISPTSCRPAVATLSDPVMLNTMSTPKIASEARSIGSSTRWRSRTLLHDGHRSRPRLQNPTLAASTMPGLASSVWNTYAATSHAPRVNPTRIPRLISRSDWETCVRCSTRPARNQPVGATVSSDQL